MRARNCIDEGLQLNKRDYIGNLNKNAGRDAWRALQTAGYVTTTFINSSDIVAPSPFTTQKPFLVSSRLDSIIFHQSISQISLSLHILKITVLHHSPHQTVIEGQVAVYISLQFISTTTAFGHESWIVSSYNRRLYLSLRIRIIDWIRYWSYSFWNFSLNCRYKCNSFRSVMDFSMELVYVQWLFI